MSNSQEQLQVAIIGASGIGKNHAAWFHKNGARICAFAGSSEESLARTSGVLAERIGYAPPGYTKLEQLFKEARPDAVCIASPPELHFQQTRVALTNNAAVLCEKPLVYDPNLAVPVVIEQAHQLAREAQENNRLLGTQMQYSLIAEQLCELADTTPRDVTSFEMTMETKNLKPGRSHETIWIELAPHPLSVLQRIAGEAQLDASSIRCTVEAMQTTAEFKVQRTTGKEIDARLIMRCNPEASTPMRRFVLNGNAVDYAGRKNANGDFLTYLSTNQREVEMPDLVDLLIANFIAACNGKTALEVTGEDGARNVAWLLNILERGMRA